MARPKIDPVVRAFEAVTALTTDERREFQRMLDGFNRTGLVVESAPKPARPRQKKPQAEAGHAAE